MKKENPVFKIFAKLEKEIDVTAFCDLAMELWKDPNTPKSLKRWLIEYGEKYTGSFILYLLKEDRELSEELIKKVWKNLEEKSSLIADFICYPSVSDSTRISFLNNKEVNDADVDELVEALENMEPSKKLLEAMTKSPNYTVRKAAASYNFIPWWLLRRMAKNEEDEEIRACIITNDRMTTSIFKVLLNDEGHRVRIDIACCVKYLYNAFPNLRNEIIANITTTQQKEVLNEDERRIVQRAIEFLKDPY